MGQLTNLFVSSSYQGLLKMTDSTNGLTNTLQTVQTGDGDNSPLQLSLSQVNISGSLTVNGQPIEFSNTGSFVTTSSFNAYTSSVQNEINGLATTSSLTSLSSSIATTDLGQNNRLGSLESKTGSYATTSSNIFNGDQTITGSVNITGNISATSASFTYVNTVYESASIIYSSGSNQFGDASDDTQTLWGRVNVPSGPVSITGSVTATSFTGSLQGTVTGSLQGTASYATQALSASYAPPTTINTGSFVTSVVGGPISFENTVVVTKGNGTINTVTVNNVTNAVSSSQATNANALGNVSSSFYARRNATNTFTADQTIDSGSILIAYEINADVNERLLILSDGTTSGPGARIIFGDTPSGGSPGVLSDTSVSITGSLGVSAGITGSLQGNASSATNASNFSNRGIAQFALTGSNSFNGNQTITGSVSASAGFVGNLTGTASYATQALSASWAPGVSIDTGSFATTGSNTFIGNQNVIGNITGSSLRVNNNTRLDGTLTVTNDTTMTGDLLIQSTSPKLKLRDTSGGGFSSGYDLRVDTGSFEIYDDTHNRDVLSDFFNTSTSKHTTSLTSENIIISGSDGVTILGPLTATGSLEGTASFATNALTASFALNGGGGSGNRDGLITTGSAASVQSITGSLILSGSAGVELQVLGDQLNTGSLTIRSGSLSTLSTTTPDYSSYLSSSEVGQSNIVLGWGDNLQTAGPAAVLANYTGSLRITGSNNIVQMPQIRGVAIGATADSQGYISGSGNFLLSNQGGIFLNTGSLLFPKTQANIVGNGSSISMNFTTSSLPGGHPIMNNNIVMGGGLIFNHNSGSLSAGTNAVLGGNITSVQNFVTNTRPSIASNNIIGSVLINHISSSVNFNSNYSNAGTLNINNNVSSSITNNSLNVTNNVIFGGSGGQPIGIYTSGSQSSNVTRLISDNIFGGRNVSVSSSFVNSSNSNLISSLVVGNGLTVIGNNTTGTNGGSAFVGRFNDTTTLNLAQDIVFAVGTGTAVGTRRTGLYVTSGSLVGVSGSLDVKGNTTITGSITLSGSAGPELIVLGDSVLSGSVYGAVNSLSITSNTASLNLANGNFFTLALPTGVNTFVSASNVLPGQTINLAITNGGTGTISFSNNVKQPSGSFYTATTGSGVIDVVTLLSVDTNNLYMNNVKNLI